MKKLLLSIFVLIGLSSFGQKVDTLPNSIQVKPIVLNAINADTLFQVKIQAFGLIIGDTTSGCNTYVTFHDRKGNKIGEKNVPIPASVVNKWGTEDTSVINYILGILGLTKK